MIMRKKERKLLFSCSKYLANLYLAIRRHLCYYVYNNRNEVKRGQKFRGKIW